MWVDIVRYGAAAKRQRVLSVVAVAGSYGHELGAEDARRNHLDSDADPSTLPGIDYYRVRTLNLEHVASE